MSDRFSAIHLLSKMVCACVMDTYPVDLFDDVFESDGSGETIIMAEGLCGDVLKHHLHRALIQLEALDCSRG